MDKPNLVNLPNGLTMLRMLMIPAFVYLHHALPARRYAALIVYVAAALTDFLDGYIARRRNQITWLGKLLDPLADKLMTAAMLYCLVSSGEIPWWPLGVFVAKELYMIAGASLLLSKNCVVKSDRIGKAATFGFVLSTCLIYPWHMSGTVANIGRALLYASLALALTAAVHYTVQALKNREEFDVN